MTINLFARRLAPAAAVFCFVSFSAHAEEEPRFESLVVPCDEMPIEAQIADAAHCSDLFLTPGNATDELARSVALISHDPINPDVPWSFAYFFDNPELLSPIETDEQWFPSIFFPVSNDLVDPISVAQLFSTASIW